VLEPEDEPLSLPASDVPPDDDEAPASPPLLDAPASVPPSEGTPHDFRPPGAAVPMKMSGPQTCGDAHSVLDAQNWMGMLMTGTDGQVVPVVQVPIMVVRLAIPAQQT
jgi:hypothetical protein